MDFNDINARTELQRRVFEEKKRKEENIWRERVRRIRVEMDEAREYVVALIQIVEELFEPVSTSQLCHQKIVQEVLRQKGSLFCT